MTRMVVFSIKNHFIPTYILYVAANVAFLSQIAYISDTSITDIIIIMKYSPKGTQ